MSRFEHACSKGHWLAGPERLERCLVFVRGRPCTGSLRQIAPPPGRSTSPDVPPTKPASWRRGRPPAG